MFKRKPKAPNDAEFRGPLELVPGDRVLYYQQEFTLAGVIFLVSGKDRRCQYHFLDADSQHFVIAFTTGPDPRITLEHTLPEDEHPDTGDGPFDFGGETFGLESSEDARAFAIGGIPEEKGTGAACRTFVDEDEMEVIVVEDWDGYIEVRKGDAIHENELVVKRQRDEEDWDIKPPPRIDLRSLNEARRTKEMEARAKVERAQANDLASARAKLAAFEDDTPVEESEDIVALSDIVDVQHRFPDEEPEPFEEEEAEPVEDEEPSRAEPADDPFCSVFEEDETDKTSDPYQEYMDADDDGDPGLPAPAPVDSEPLFPNVDPEESPPPDEERAEFLSAGIFGDDDDDFLG